MVTSTAVETIPPTSSCCCSSSSCASRTEPPEYSGSAGISDVLAIRQKFPIFDKHPDIIFFDNASTTQKPASVIESITNFYSSACANAGRSSYSFSTRLTTEIETARRRVAKFINASTNNLAFTSGATDSLNMVALGWGISNLDDGDEILVCFEDHKSAVLPWLNLQRILAESGRKIHIVPYKVHEVGDYDLKDIKANLSSRTRLIAMSHVHHVYGMDMEVADIRAIVGKDVLISLDASQSIGHIPVDVQKLGVDFLSFSAHKMFASNGTGVLWVNPAQSNKLFPIRVGGMGAAHIGNNSIVIPKEASLASLLESGTQNIPGILSLCPALDFIEELGIESISKHISHLTRYLYESIKSLPGIDFAPGPGRCGCPGGYGIISFSFEQVSSSDLTFLLDSENIFVRSGDHCLSKESNNYIRVSMHAYNTEEEIDRFVHVLAANVS